MSGFELIKTEDGSWTLQSTLHGELYHSRHGAIQESKHVFIKHGLYTWLKDQNAPVAILEIGFGSGLNAFLTYLEARKSNIRIDYTAVEAYPIPPEVYTALEYPAILKAVEFSDIFLKMHEIPFGEPQPLDPLFTLEKNKISFEEIRFTDQFDLIFMDAFAPSAQPQFWENPFIKQLFTALKQNGLLTTYCAKGSFKRALREAGFKVVAVPGPPGKREMTTAYKV